MLFDTGSADLWIYSKQGCEKSNKCPKRDYYDEESSTTFKDLSKNNFIYDY